MSYDVPQIPEGQHPSFKEIKVLVDNGHTHEHLKRCPICHLTFTKLGGNPRDPVAEFVLLDPRLMEADDED